MARQRSACILIVVCGLMMTIASVGNTSEITASDHVLDEAGWKELGIPGELPTQYRMIDSDTIDVRSSSSVSILYRALMRREQNARMLEWRWRVDKSVPATDPADAGNDDRDLAVHIWFADDQPEGLWKSLSTAVSSVLGIPRIGKVLTYVFGGTGPRLRRLVNPHHDPDGVIVLLRPSGTETGKWFSEQIDFVADFKTAFGAVPPPPMYLAISADSDDTRAESTGRIAAIRFRER